MLPTSILNEVCFFWGTFFFAASLRMTPFFTLHVSLLVIMVRILKPLLALLWIFRFVSVSWSVKTLDRSDPPGYLFHGLFHHWHSKILPLFFLIYFPIMTNISSFPLFTIEGKTRRNFYVRSNGMKKDYLLWPQILSRTSFISNFVILQQKYLILPVFLFNPNFLCCGADTQNNYFCPGTGIWILKCPENLFGQIF